MHVVRSLDPAAGGPPQVALRLAAGQASLGHEVHLVAYAGPTSAERQQDDRIPGRDRLVAHVLPRPNRLERVLAMNARKLLSRLCAEADFVHLHGVWDPIVLSAALAAARAGVPYCFRPAGMLDPWSLSQKRWKKRAALTLAYRAPLRQAAFIHVLNADEQRLIEPLGLGVPSVVLPNGVFLEEIEPLPGSGSFRAAHGELGSAPYVLFLSRLHFKKGLDVLGEAFRLLAADTPDARLVVAGPDEGARADFIRQIARCGLEQRVHVVGPLYGTDKLAALVDAACFCLPSRQEGFSVAITEALACGVPVVITDACHFPEVGEAGAGAIVPLEPAAIAASLRQIMRDRERAAAMGAAGASLVRARFTWPRIAEASIRAYQAARPVRA